MKPIGPLPFPSQPEQVNMGPVVNVASWHAHLVHGVGAPAVGVCQIQNILPVLEVGDDFEGLGDLADRIPAVFSHG